MKILYALFKNNKFLYLINVMATAILYCLIVFLFISARISSTEVDAADHLKGKNIYQLADSLLNEKEMEFFRNNNSYTILNDFANEIESSPQVGYYIANWQPIDTVNFKGGIEFDAYYETGSNREPYTFKGTTFRTVKSVQVNEETFDMFNIQLSSGQRFSKNDYKYSPEDDRIPLILGADLREYYKIGDEVEFQLYQRPFTGEVIGFVQPSQKIMTSRDPETLLDRYVILPSQAFDEVTPQLLRSHQKDSPVFVRASLYSRINGYIVSEQKPAEVRSFLKGVSDATGFHDYVIIGADEGIINSIIQITEWNRNALYGAALIVLAAMLSLFLLSVFINIKRNTGTYLALLINGADMESVNRLISRQFMGIILLGFIPPLLILIVATPHLSTLVYVCIALALAIFSLLSIAIYYFGGRVLRRMDIIQKLKG